MLRSKKYPFLLLVLAAAILSSCTTVDLYEKVVSLPRHEWSSSNKPQFKFEIKDTTVPYRIFVVFRHSEKYNYNNIWLNLYTQGPGVPQQKAQYELPLSSGDKGWLGTSMDDLYEHRIALTPNSQDFYFKRAGEYTFTLEQIMREDPLQSVYNVGLRIEKKQ